jgi:hypothetical protein
MLTQRDRSWSSVRESLRRQRTVHDLIHRSGSARLQRRVSIPEDQAKEWRQLERLIVETERILKSLNPNALDFWTEFRHREADLIKLFHDASVEFVR